MAWIFVGPLKVALLLWPHLLMLLNRQPPTMEDQVNIYKQYIRQSSGTRENRTHGVLADAQHPQQAARASYFGEAAQAGMLTPGDGRFQPEHKQHRCLFSKQQVQGRRRRAPGADTVKMTATITRARMSSATAIRNHKTTTARTRAARARPSKHPPGNYFLRGPGQTC